MGALESGRAGRAIGLRKITSSGVCRLRAPRGLFGGRRTLRGVATEPRGAMRKGGQGLAASITEAARLKIGAHRSPKAGLPPDRSLRRWVSRALLAPNVRSRPTCCKAHNNALRTSGFLSSHRSSGSSLTSLCRITFNPHLLRCLAVGTVSLPAGDGRECKRVGNRSNWRT